MPGDGDTTSGGQGSDGPVIPEGFGKPADGAAVGGPETDAREAMDLLDRANRIQTEARMLPKGYRLADEAIRETARRFGEFIAAHHISAAAAARACDYSDTVLSEWQAGKYKGNNSAIAHAVNDWMEREGRRRSAARPGDYVSTRLAEDIRNIALRADKRCRMAAIVAPAGCGKTYVLKALAEEMRGLYLSCGEGMRGIDVYRELADLLGWKGGRRSGSQFRHFIVDQLRGTNRPIFVDEAHQLGRHVGTLRTIYDQAQVAIVMAGTAEILNLVNDRAHGNGQFSSRTDRWNALDQTFDAERPGDGERGRDLFSIEEIRSYFAMKKIRLADDDALALLWGIACLPSHGTLRQADAIAITALDIYGHEAAITRRQLVKAMGMLMGSEGKYLETLSKRHVERPRARVAV